MVILTVVQWFAKSDIDSDDFVEIGELENAKLNLEHETVAGRRTLFV